MNSFLSTFSEYGGMARDYMHAFMDWAEHNPGLGGWVGAIGAVLAIFVTWGLSRAEYQRVKNRDYERREKEIDLLLKIVSEFDAVMNVYFASAGDDRDTFYQKHINDPKWHSMADLANMPITQWPSIESYVSFKTYWFKSIQDMESKFIDPDLAGKVADHQLRLSNLMKALDGARG